MLYKNAKVIVLSPDGDTDFFDILVGVLLRDSLAPYLLIRCQDYVLRTSIDLIKSHFKKDKKQTISRRNYDSCRLRR